MRTPTELVTFAFRNPAAAWQFSMGDWDRLVRQARHAGLLARLHGVLRDRAADASIPDVARWHFEAAAFAAETQQAELRGTLKRLRTLLVDIKTPLIALKGTACVAASLPALCGREVDAIDLLVPRETLDRIASRLAGAGWREARLPDYERKCRRRWHREPQHRQRAAVLDLHHAIVPDGARFHPDAQRLRRRAREVPGFPGVAVLSAADRILHAATALMHDDGLHRGLRDLSDLDLMLRAEATEADFWSRLISHAEEMELERALFYALRYVRHFFATPVPEDVVERLRVAAPCTTTLMMMDAIYLRMLAPHHHSCTDALTPLARHAAYLHAHWLRRPPRQLLPHLIRKPFAGGHRREPSPA